MEKQMEDVIAAAVEIERVTASDHAGKKGNIIVATGRGGTGKSTFVALASRYLPPPLLLLDIDPDQSLADMLGVDLESTEIETEAGREIKIKTVSDLANDIEAEDAFIELGGGPPTVKIPLLLEWYARYSSQRFTLISLGPRWTMGDYRTANYLFEFVIPSIGENFTNIIVDSPAGLEHLNRKVVPNIDDLFVILDPSMKSIKHISRVNRIARATGINYRHLYLAGNSGFDQEAEQRLRDTGETYLGKMDFDASVRDFNLRGESLLNLPDSSPACQSVREILTKAGYTIG